MRVRNKELRLVQVTDILDNPRNHRNHPDGQREAFAGAVDQIGWVGYPDVFEPPDYPGKVMLHDGHLRREDLLRRGIQEIEVNVTDLTPEEASFHMLTTDTLGAMAEADPAKLDELLRDVQTSSQAVADMLEELAEDAGVVPNDKEPPEDFPEVDEDIETAHTCPSCGYKWSGGE